MTEAEVGACLFCAAERPLRYGCTKQRSPVCGDHFMVACPLCGHVAFWMEGCKCGRAHYACFATSPWCDWVSEAPPVVPAMVCPMCQRGQPCEAAAHLATT